MAVLVGVSVAVDVAVLVGVSVTVPVGVAVGVSVGVPVAVLVGVLVGVSVGVDVGVLVGVSVGVLVGVFVEVLVGVFVGVLVGVFVGVLVGVLVTTCMTTFGRFALPWPTLARLADVPTCPVGFIADVNTGSASAIPANRTAAHRNTSLAGFATPTPVVPPRSADDATRATLPLVTIRVNARSRPSLPARWCVPPGSRAGLPIR